MGREITLSLADNIAAAQDWWREAGVDQHFLDDPQCLLAEPLREPEALAAGPAQSVTRVSAAASRQKIGGEAATWPNDLAEFRKWWLEEPSLGEGGAFPRIAATGGAEAKLLVLVAMPEAEDHETLLSGPHGRLVANMARAMGLAREDLYLASALPRHMPMPDWPALGEGGLGALTLHHIALAQPERCIVMGRDLHTLLDAGEGPPVLPTYSPESLLTNARLRADLWRRWLDWEHSPR